MTNKKMLKNTPLKETDGKMLTARLDPQVVFAEFADSAHRMLDALLFEDLAFVEAYHQLARALLRRRLARLDAKGCA